VSPVSKPWPFVKGHGTQNDFVLLPDPDGVLELDAAAVRAICDRRRGLGADGVLRVVPTKLSLEPDVEALSDEAAWFMDYRNADGSLSEMCGNGLRVFVRYLLTSGLAVGPDVPVATRSGVRLAHVVDADTIAVDMGAAILRGDGVASVTVASVTGAERTWAALGLEVPNPHAVAFVDDLAEAGLLRDAPVAGPSGTWPDGVNIEFVRIDAPGRLAMRVFERGVGETRSCGTGACAAVVAARLRLLADRGADVPAGWDVEVPGGLLRVTESADGSLELAGPAVLVASGTLDLATL
jgi:diaminopimelate epimerase